jgi:hypothetical protein
MSRVLLLALVLQAAATLPDFSGLWTLDALLSDPPEQVARELREDTAQPNQTDIFGAGGVGESRGRRGAPAPKTSRTDPIGEADRKLLEQLTTSVQFPPTTLSVSQTNAELTVAGQTIRLDGKPDTRQVNSSGAVERTAAWEGPQLVVREKVGHAGTLRTIYSTVPATRQLLVRVNFERDGQLGPFEIKLVYDSR